MCTSGFHQIFKGVLELKKKKGLLVYEQHEFEKKKEMVLISALILIVIKVLITVPDLAWSEELIIHSG